MGALPSRCGINLVDNGVGISDSLVNTLSCVKYRDIPVTEMIQLAMLQKLESSSVRIA